MIFKVESKAGNTHDEVAGGVFWRLPAFFLDQEVSKRMVQGAILFIQTRSGFLVPQTPQPIRFRPSPGWRGPAGGTCWNGRCPPHAGCRRTGFAALRRGVCSLRAGAHVGSHPPGGTGGNSQDLPGNEYASWHNRPRQQSNSWCFRQQFIVPPPPCSLLNHKTTSLYIPRQNRMKVLLRIVHICCHYFHQPTPSECLLDWKLPSGTTPEFKNQTSRDFTDLHASVRFSDKSVRMLIFGSVTWMDVCLEEKQTISFLHRQSAQNCSKQFILFASHYSPIISQPNLFFFRQKTLTGHFPGKGKNETRRKLLI